MGHVTFAELVANAVANASDVNSGMTSWNTQSTDIDGTNVREEGLDRRSVAAGAVVPVGGQDSYLDNTSAAFTNTSEALVSTGADVFCGPISIDESDGDVGIIRCSARIRVDGKAVGTQTRVTVRLKYTEDASPTAGGTWTTVSNTERVYEMDDGQYTGTVPDERGVYSVSHLFDQGGVFTSTTFHVGLFAWISNGTGTYDIDQVALSCVTYSR